MYSPKANVKAAPDPWHGPQTPLTHTTPSQATQRYRGIREGRGAPVRRGGEPVGAGRAARPGRTAGAERPSPRGGGSGGVPGAFQLEKPGAAGEEEEEAAAAEEEALGRGKPAAEAQPRRQSAPRLPAHFPDATRGHCRRPRGCGGAAGGRRGARPRALSPAAPRKLGGVPSLASRGAPSPPRASCMRGPSTGRRPEPPPAAPVPPAPRATPPRRPCTA